MRRYLTPWILFLAAGLVPAAQAADPFLSPPGVAERGMGGAMTAGSGSLAAIWHNPATLVDGDTRVELEWQSAPDRREDGTLRAGSNAWFFGASWVNRDKWYGTVATGVAAYTPHNMKFWSEQTGEPRSAFGRTNITTQVVGVPYAVEFDELGLALGAVGEIVAVDPSGSDIRIQRADGDVSEADFDDEQHFGVSGAMGARLRVHDDGPTRVDLGAVYRPGATAGARLDLDSGAAERLMPDKPGGWDIGVRWRHRFEGERALSAQAHYGSTHWGSAGHLRRDALAVSYTVPFDATAALRSGERTLRLAYSRARPHEDRGWMDWPRATAIAAGIGFDFVEGVHIDLVAELRDEERSDHDDDDSWFTGVNFGFPF